MHFDLRDVGSGRCEFLAFDVDPRFESTMAALAWQRAGAGWGCQLACQVAEAEPGLSNLNRFMLPLLRSPFGARLSARMIST